MIVKCRKANVSRIKINKTFHTADSFASSADKNKERYTNLSDYFVWFVERKVIQNLSKTNFWIGCPKLSLDQPVELPKTNFLVAKS